MKKITLLLVMLLAVVGVEAQEAYDFDLIYTSWGWSWQATPSNEGGLLKGVFESGKTEGTISRGWGPAENWSKYNKIVAVIEKYTGTSGAIQIKNGSAQIAQKHFGTITSQTTIALDFNPADFTSVTQLEFYLSGDEATEIIISRVYLEETYKYASEGTSLTYNKWGDVSANQFAGMPDETKVVFTYTLTMNGTYDVADYQGWGIGEIKGSGDNQILVTNIKSKSAGDVDVVVSKGDLNAALADENTTWHYYAVNFGVWNLGNGTDVYGNVVRKSVKAYTASAYSTISTIGWSSFSSQAALDFSTSEVEAYIATSVDESTVTLKKVSGTVAAGTGLLLKGTAGQKYNIPVVTSGTDYSSTNNLVATPSETTITSTSTGDNYVLSIDNSSNPIFAKVDNELYPATVGAGKAYLHFDVSPSRTLTFNIEDEVTGINETKATKAHNTNTFFNLAGQRISQPTKGVYIVNGKKVIIK